MAGIVDAPGECDDHDGTGQHRRHQEVEGGACGQHHQRVGPGWGMQGPGLLHGSQGQGA